MRITYKSKYTRISSITDRLLNRIYINFPPSPPSSLHITTLHRHRYRRRPHLRPLSQSRAAASLRSRHGHMNPSPAAKRTLLPLPPRQYSGGDNPGIGAVGLQLPFPVQPGLLSSSWLRARASPLR